MIKLPIFNRENRTSNKFLTLTINSHEVRCLTFYYDEGSYKIIGAGSRELENGAVRNGVIVEKDAVELASQSTIAAALENSEEKVRNVIYGVNGDLCLGHMTTVRLKRNTPSPISGKEVSELYSKTLNAAFMQSQNTYLEITGDPEVELENITSSNVYLKVNNHPVQDLEGKEGNVVEAAIFNAFSPAFHLKSLQKLADRTGLNIIAVGSEMYAVSEWIKRTNRLALDYLIIGIEADSTNVAVIFGGGIVATKNLNFGLDHFVKDVSEKMGITLNEARNILKSYMSGKLAESENAVVANCVRDAIELWVMGMEILFGEFTGVKTFPSKVYVTGIGSELSDLMNTIETEPWTKSIPFKEPPQFSKINFSNLEIMDSLGRVNGVEWINTAALSIIYGEILGT